jgi:hypothetical protein
MYLPARNAISEDCHPVKKTRGEVSAGRYRTINELVAEKMIGFASAIHVQLHVPNFPKRPIPIEILSRLSL